MRLPFEILALLAHVLHTAAVPLSRRSTPFRSLRGLSPLVNSFSNGHTYAHAPTKYFYESTFNSHYDGRFASAEVPFQERIWNLRLMLKAYTDTMEKIGIQTWIMHGCLLGWWWGGGLMPWDKDLDFLMDEEGMRELGEWWNMTVHHFEAKDFGLEDQLSIESDHWASERSNEDEEDEETQSKRQEWEHEVRKNGKKYLMEVNPNYTNQSTTDKYNLIDARWIDVSNGLYIDITTLHVAPVAPEPYASPYTSLHPSAHEVDDEDDEIQMYVKDTHAYLSTQIYPLRSSTFENVPVKVPYAYEELLLEEYGSDALTESWYNGYLFDPKTKLWNKAKPNEAQRAYFKQKNGRDVGRLSGTGRIGHGWRGQGSVRNAGSSFMGDQGASETEDRWAD
ncbi:mannosylphosphorylation protein [Stemphylium lycopersici]|uniref:Mannosylphosphorylation protein n=1 Tax=Stemphylium lycopersici TaxID=183478 RepID=A0A364N7U9_STELY|nr:mannosylphosphorylation protein [Stemphylium lycopersici]RAR02597.1 mannosylphosphorylation protein [Stemphylium lycopersici]RAR13121.1 mannosylphosphorylation protein [Stemphylium lycopersici]